YQPSARQKKLFLHLHYQKAQQSLKTHRNNNKSINKLTSKMRWERKYEELEQERFVSKAMINYMLETTLLFLTVLKR
ncbi:hypothetical protein, partial [Bacillus wiedmannii]|uniref:hypothetical protein n=1 Tax=Bacillus wiedmannii TaxID=1890302 RepID=UPI00359C7B19